jgi:hypothetical protein
MTLTLIATFAGLLFGSIWAGAVGEYLLLTRSYRQNRNLVVIGLGYLLVGTVSIGSLSLLLLFCGTMGIVRHSLPDNAAVCAYAISSACVLLFAGRAELPWRRSVGLYDKT